MKKYKKQQKMRVNPSELHTSIVEPRLLAVQYLWIHIFADFYVECNSKLFLDDVYI